MAAGLPLRRNRSVRNLTVRNAFLATGHVHRLSKRARGKPIFGVRSAMHARSGYPQNACVTTVGSRAGGWDSCAAAVRSRRLGGMAATPGKAISGLLKLLQTEADCQNRNDGIAPPGGDSRRDCGGGLHRPAVRQTAVHHGLRESMHDADPRGFEGQAARRLAIPIAAPSLDTLRFLPRNRLEALRGRQVRPTLHPYQPATWSVLRVAGRPVGPEQRCNRGLPQLNKGDPHVHESSTYS